MYYMHDNNDDCNNNNIFFNLYSHKVKFRKGTVYANLPSTTLMLCKKIVSDELSAQDKQTTKKCYGSTRDYR